MRSGGKKAPGTNGRMNATAQSFEPFTTEVRVFQDVPSMVGTMMLSSGFKLAIVSISLCFANLGGT